LDTFNVIVGIIGTIIGIASFIFAIWVWMRYNMRHQEFTRIIRAIHDTVDKALWRAEGATIETDAMRLQQADRNLGALETIWNFTAEQLGVNDSANVESSLRKLIGEGTVLSGAMIDRLESSQDTTEVWLATPDLKPDSVDKALGKRVNESLKKGKQYVYFYPANLEHADAEVARLYSNIGTQIRRSKLNECVTVVPLNEDYYTQLFPQQNNTIFPQHNNIIMCFRDQDRIFLPRCFGEVSFTKEKERGAFWQEHDEATTRSLYHLLHEALMSYNASSSQALSPSTAHHA
jgi:hypothetical protein